LILNGKPGGETLPPSQSPPGLLMFKIFRRKTDRVRQQQARRIADLESQVESQKRIISVLQVERDALAEVVARNRQRTLAETSEFVRRRAELEGLK
jgi:hypothetical protein